jgi:radical SAM superfamily enzyme YgiQ (UPF0313 family)
MKPRPHAIVIAPWVTDFKLYDEWMHPLGLYVLISLLRHNGLRVSFFNCLTHHGHAKQKPYATGTFHAFPIAKPAVYRHIPRLYKRYGCSTEELVSFLDRAGPADVICIGSGMTYWIDGLLECAAAIHRHRPYTPMVIGGTAAMLIPAHLSARLPYAHICSRSLHATTSRNATSIPVIDSLSTTGWVPALYEAFTMAAPRPHGALLTSLGCPLRCSYCASSLLQPRFTQRPHDLICREVRYYARNGIRHCACYDDALLYRAPDHFLPLIRRLRVQCPDMRFHLPNGIHMQWLTAEVVREMKRAGILTIRCGYESGMPSQGPHTSYKASYTTAARTSELLHAHGYEKKECGIYVMAGLPGQRPEQLRNEMEKIARLDVQVKPVFLSPVPHTPLFDHYAAGIPDIIHDPRTHNDTVFTPLLPHWDAPTVEEIKQLAKRLNS